MPDHERGFPRAIPDINFILEMVTSAAREAILEHYTGLAEEELDDPKRLREFLGGPFDPIEVTDLWERCSPLLSRLEFCQGLQLLLDAGFLVRIQQGRTIWYALEAPARDSEQGKEP